MRCICIWLSSQRNKLIFMRRFMGFESRTAATCERNDDWAIVSNSPVLCCFGKERTRKCCHIKLKETVRTHLVYSFNEFVVQFVVSVLWRLLPLPLIESNRHVNRFMIHTQHTHTPVTPYNGQWTTVIIIMLVWFEASIIISLDSKASHIIITAQHRPVISSRE